MWEREGRTEGVVVAEFQVKQKTALGFQPYLYYFLPKSYEDQQT